MWNTCTCTLPTLFNIVRARRTIGRCTGAGFWQMTFWRVWAMIKRNAGSIIGAHLLTTLKSRAAATEKCWWDCQVRSVCRKVWRTLNVVTVDRTYKKSSVCFITLIYYIYLYIGVCVCVPRWIWSSELSKKFIDLKIFFCSSRNKSTSVLKT